MLVLDDALAVATLEAPEEAVAAARGASSPLNGGSSVAVAMQDGRAQADGPGQLELARDTLGHVRRAALTSTTLNAEGVRTTRTHITYWFEASGLTIGVGHVYQISLPSACKRDVAPWFVDIWLDPSGDIVSVEPRLPPQPDPDVDGCAPLRPPGMTVAVYPNALSLLDAVGVTDVDALPWETAPVRPPR